MPIHINTAILWRVVNKFNNRLNKVRLKSFVPHKHFTPSLLQTWQLFDGPCLQKKLSIHLNLVWVSFSVLSEDLRNPAVIRINFGTNWQLTKLKENEPFIRFFFLSFCNLMFPRILWACLRKLYGLFVWMCACTYHRDMWFRTSGCSTIHFRFVAPNQLITQNTSSVL